MTSLVAPSPVAVQHADHDGPLLACPLCRRQSSYGVFRRRYWALRGRRGVARTRLAGGVTAG